MVVSANQERHVELLPGYNFYGLIKELIYTFRSLFEFSGR